MIIWVLLALAAAFGAGAWLGAPYLPILNHDLQALLDLAELKQGETLLDLGCGDGRLLRAAARREVKAVGLEINPLLFAIAWLGCLPYRRFATVHLGNFWKRPWPQADVIYVFLIDRYMTKLDQALRQRVTNSTRVVSYVFEIPGQRSVRSNKNAWVYHYPISGN